MNFMLLQSNRVKAMNYSETQIIDSEDIISSF